jgi:serine/threonine-protein kinase
MAEVHRGRDLRLGRDVAVKLLRADLARDESFIVRFRREAQNSASLNHPNIVAVFDTGEQDGIPYMVMEYVDGKTLKEILVAEGRFDATNACEVAADMCSALDFSHKHHIIHRDVKPGNVMMSGTGQIKVMDFGIARALASGQATMTQTSAVIGTAQYLSPEQARGETVDARSDVYAVGCVLYELLVGHPPFTGDNPVSVAYQHVREEPRLASQLNPMIPPAVDAVIMKALSKNPENRYESAGEMREDLLRAARGGDVTAPMIMGDDARTQLIGGADSTAPIEPIETESSKKKGWLIALGVIAGIALLGLAGWAIARALATDPGIPVPDVVGETQAVATEMLEEAGFVVIPEEQEATDPTDDDIGNVIDQDPAGGTEHPVDTEITITVLVRPGEVTLPSVVGDQYEDAHETLTALGFEVVLEEREDTAPAGQVLGQTPDGNSQQPYGTEVRLVVSAGGQTTVENVVGSTEETAKSRLEGAGFRVDVQYVDEGGTVGTVVRQDPSGGSTANSGTTVTIYVQGVTVNWEVGGSASTLYNQLTGAGLRVTVEPDEGDSDVIESVDVQSGTVVAPGSSVTITVVPEDDNGGGGGGDCDPEEEDCDENGGFLPPGGNGYVAPTNTWARNE